jgi:hypothetical protein
MNNQLLDLDESFGQWLHEGMKPIQTFIQRGGEEYLHCEAPELGQLSFRSRIELVVFCDRVLQPRMLNEIGWTQYEKEEDLILFPFPSGVIHVCPNCVIESVTLDLLMAKADGLSGYPKSATDPVIRQLVKKQKK